MARSIDREVQGMHKAFQSTGLSEEQVRRSQLPPLSFPVLMCR